MPQSTAPNTDGPDLSIELEPVEYSAEAEAFIETLEYSFPQCGSCPPRQY